MPFRAYTVQRQAEMFVVGDSKRELHTKSAWFSIAVDLYHIILYEIEASGLSVKFSSVIIVSFFV
jgi:hypothetical protein